MTNNISPISSQPIRSVQSGLEKQAQLDSPKAASRAGDSDISNVRSSVQAMAAKGPPLDKVRVAAIREAIARGDFPVDSRVIAERMIALDLPGAGKS